MLKSKILKVITVFLLAVTVLTSCGNRGLSVGFGGRGDVLNDIMGAAKSDKTDFDIDDVTLDFYYGGYISGFSEDDDRKMLGIALYFFPEENSETIQLNAPYEDYRSIDGFYFVKLISAEEFSSGGYGVKATFFKTTFEHSEPLTVPADVFLQDGDHFGLAFLEIYSLNEQPDYYVFYASYLAMRYEFLNDRTVRLSKPNHTLW